MRYERGRTCCPEGRLWGITALIVVLGVGFGGCGDDDATGNNNGNNSNVVGCPAGHATLGPACVPQFDPCPGSDQVARLGGGCLEVGVTQCATGFSATGDGSCDPVLPSAPCGAGTMPMLGQTTCQPVGVTNCPAGFVSDGGGGCEPVLPASSCAGDEIEVLGESQCQPLGDCGTGTFGNIAPAAGTVYVDTNTTAGSPDGSLGAPYPTVFEALAVVAAGERIAIAAGVYDESLVLDREVLLTGRCASMVRINGTGADAAVRVVAAGSSSQIHGVTLGGSAAGLEVSGATGVTMTESRVTATGAHGVDVEADGELQLTRVKVDQATGMGIYFQGARLELFECLVQDTLSEGDDSLGRGLSAACDATGDCGEMFVVSSIFQRNRDVSVYYRGADLTISDTLIRDSLLQVSDGTGGWGLAGRCDPDANVCGTMTVSGVTILDSHDQALTSAGIVTTVSGVTIRRVAATAAGLNGFGVVAFCDPAVGTCGTFELTDSIVDESRDAAIMVFGPEILLRRTIVQNSLGRQSDDAQGVGIVANCMSASQCGAVRIEDCLVANNRTSGIMAGGPDLSIVRTVVRDTQPQLSDGLAGVGIGVQCDQSNHVCGSLEIASCIVERNHTTGIAVAGPDTVIRATLVRDTEAHLNDDTMGWGVMTGCDPVEDVCGTVVVEGCVIENNMEMGIIAGSTPLSISQTVVRGTLPTAALAELTAASFGIALGCDGRGNCGTTTVSDTMLEHNHGIGIGASGVELTVERTVVRDTTLMNDVRGYAVGIWASVTPDDLSAPVTVRDSLVDGTLGVGVSLYGVDAVIESSTVRHCTGTPNHINRFAAAVNSLCRLDRPDLCGSVTISESVLTDNERAGFGALGVASVVRSTLISSTLDNLADTGSGFALEASCYQGACAPVTIENCGLEESTGTGILLENVPATVHRTAVIGTNTVVAGLDTRNVGYGIAASCTLPQCPTLQVTECLVQHSATAGLLVDGYSGAVRATTIEAVEGHPADGAHGYGVQVSGQAGGPVVSFDVTDCDLLDAQMAGVLYHQASGVVSDTRISGADFPVVLSTGANAEISDSNELSGTLSSEPTWATVEPSAAPSPDEPVDINAAPELP